jgi:hypothetical protein
MSLILGSILTKFNRRISMKNNKQLTKLQKKYINRMMNTKVKKTEEFNTDLIKETHKKHMKEIREKYSPTGGRTPFQKTDG